MEPSKNRGRGYGRSRGAQQPPGQPGRQQQPQQQPPAAQPPQQAAAGAWGVRQPAPASVWPRPQIPVQRMPAPEAPVAGRGRSMDSAATAGPSKTIEKTTQGHGDSGNERGSGYVRGRVVDRNKIVFRTKPAHMQNKQGTSGAPINLQANFLPVLQHEKWCLFHYNVVMEPDIDNTSKRRYLMRTAMKDKLPGFLFDGTSLFTPNKLHPDPMELFVADDDGEKVRITVNLVGDLAWGDAHYIQLFNILVRKFLAMMGLQLVGRNYYLPDGKVNLNEHKIQLWPGYFTSMRQHEKNILLNVDLQFKFMRTDNVYDMLMECDRGNVKQEFIRKVAGSVVLTYYNNKTYTIDDVDFSKNPSDSFQLRDGSEITFAQYYESKYKVRIRNMGQPLLVSRSKAREIRAGMPETVILIPELCQLTGLTDRQRENFQLMKALGEYTRLNPEKRIHKLMDFANKLNRTPEIIEEIKKWDLTFGKELVRFKGRKLGMETMIAGADKRCSSGREADWTRDVRSMPMFVLGRVDRLAVITPAKLKSSTTDFMSTLVRCASGMSFNINNFRVFDIHDDRANSYLQEMERVISTASPTLIIVILPNNSQDRYNAVKKKGNVEKGVPTQVVVAKNLTAKGVMSIATKIAVQINCKVGGAPWSIGNPMSSVMVVGYDVCRDTVHKRKSFAAMVATLNRQMSHYYHAVYAQEVEQELSTNFGSFMVLACEEYKKVNKAYPDRILIYRDGVGDGQIQFVKENEVENIKTVLKQNIYKDRDLKMAFIVVSKRINTKIFTQDGNNPPPGTVVDDVITLPERYDFFIVSQCVKQGTVGPTSYNVLEDTLGLNPDQLQQFTYKLTHMYFNWSGTVRVPGPCQYAHKLAFLTSQSMHTAAHPNLSNKLFFL